MFSGCFINGQIRRVSHKPILHDTCPPSTIKVANFPHALLLRANIQQIFIKGGASNGKLHFLPTTHTQTDQHKPIKHAPMLLHLGPQRSRWQTFRTSRSVEMFSGCFINGHIRRVSHKPILHDTCPPSTIKVANFPHALLLRANIQQIFITGGEASNGKLHFLPTTHTQTDQHKPIKHAPMLLHLGPQRSRWQTFRTSRSVEMFSGCFINGQIRRVSHKPILHDTCPPSTIKVANFPHALLLRANIQQIFITGGGL